LLHCPQYDLPRQACQNELNRYGIELTTPLAMGFVDYLQPLTLQSDVLNATSSLFEAVFRISARRV
jgi:hypothetical protein